jgi:hypothetical protein
MMLPVALAPAALADPPADPAAQPIANAADAAPPPLDNGAVPSEDPGVVTTPDGWHLTVSAEKETQLPIPPLTTSLASREYLVGATFHGTVSGGGKGKLNGGTLETGYQIGCGISMDKIKLNGSVGMSPTIGLAGLTGVGFPIQGQIEVEPRPGEVVNVVVDKKSFKGTDARVTLRDVHIKIDNCVGQSFLRSYAILTSSAGDTDDVVAYYGVTKTV